jgi:hypothetical protein
MYEEVETHTLPPDGCEGFMLLAYGRPVGTGAEVGWAVLAEWVEEERSNLYTTARNCRPARGLVTVPTILSL